MNNEKQKSVLPAVIYVPVALALACAALLAQTQLPKPILDLFPANAVEPGGAWTSRGKMAMLNVSAHLTSKVPCVLDKAPGRIGITAKIYFDGSMILPIQGSAQEQVFSQDLRNLESTLSGLKTQSRLIRVGSIKTEDVTGGRIAYFDLLHDCSEYVHREYPEARLTGMIKTDRIFGTIEVEGPMTADQIKTVAVETMSKIVKTGFAGVGRQ